MRDRLQIANDYLGFTETKNREELKELLGIDPVKTEWCAAFVTAIEKLYGQKGTGKLAARSYLNYGEEVSKPQRGDIVVFWRKAKFSWEGHVGYFIEQDSRSVTVLGGNQDKSVKIKKYPRDRVLGYRRPIIYGEIL